MRTMTATERFASSVVVPVVVLDKVEDAVPTAMAAGGVIPSNIKENADAPHSRRQLRLPQGRRETGGLVRTKGNV